MFKNIAQSIPTSYNPSQLLNNPNTSSVLQSPFVQNLNPALQKGMIQGLNQYAPPFMQPPAVQPAMQQNGLPPPLFPNMPMQNAPQTGPVQNDNNIISYDNRGNATYAEPVNTSYAPPGQPDLSQPAVQQPALQQPMQQAMQQPVISPQMVIR